MVFGGPVISKLMLKSNIVLSNKGKVHGSHPSSNKGFWVYGIDKGSKYQKIKNPSLCGN